MEEIAIAAVNCNFFSILADGLARPNHAQQSIIVMMMPPTMLPVFVELITVRGMIAPMLLHDDRRDWIPIYAVRDCVRHRGWIYHTRVHDAGGRLDDHRRWVDDNGWGCDVHGGGNANTD